MKEKQILKNEFWTYDSSYWEFVQKIWIIPSPWSCGATWKRKKVSFKLLIDTHPLYFFSPYKKKNSDKFRKKMPFLILIKSKRGKGEISWRKFFWTIESLTFHQGKKKRRGLKTDFAWSVSSISFKRKFFPKLFLMTLAKTSLDLILLSLA